VPVFAIQSGQSSLQSSVIEELLSIHHGFDWSSIPKVGQSCV
jgi:hypothetical protein